MTSPPTRSRVSSPRRASCSRARGRRRWRAGSTGWCGACWPWRGTARPDRRRRAPNRDATPALLIQTAVPLDLLEDAAVLDLPGRGALLQVLDAAADLLVELLVDLHVLLEYVD